MTRKNDKPPHVEALRRRLEEAAKEQPKPKFRARRTRKPRRPKTASPFAIPDQFTTRSDL